MDAYFNVLLHECIYQHNLFARAELFGRVSVSTFRAVYWGEGAHWFVRSQRCQRVRVWDAWWVCDGYTVYVARADHVSPQLIFFKETWPCNFPIPLVSRRALVLSKFIQTVAQLYRSKNPYELVPISLHATHLSCKYGCTSNLAIALRDTLDK